MDYVHMRLLPVIFLSFLCASEVPAGLIVHESFSYAPGAQPENGGFGWKQAWGSDPMAITNQGLQFTDSLGDSLQVSGNASTRMSGGSAQIDAVRDLQTELSESFWFSFLVNGINGSHTVSVGLNQSMYIGQGAKDVTSAQWVFTMQTKPFSVRAAASRKVKACILLAEPFTIRQTINSQTLMCG